MMENNPETGTVSQQRRRLKIANACDTCRVKKVKCDGIRPGEEQLLSKDYREVRI